MPTVASPGLSAPISGGWNRGDPVTERLFADLGTLELENGKISPDTKLVYEIWGRLSAEKSNAVLISHVLTVDAHMVGEVIKG